MEMSAADASKVACAKFRPMLSVYDWEFGSDMPPAKKMLVSNASEVVCSEFGPTLLVYDGEFGQRYTIREGECLSDASKASSSPNQPNAYSSFSVACMLSLLSISLYLPSSSASLPLIFPHYSCIFQLKVHNACIRHYWARFLIFHPIGSVEMAQNARHSPWIHLHGQICSIEPASDYIDFQPVKKIKEIVGCM